MYVYTLQGWLKSINHADGARDPGRDGVAATTNAAFAPDAFGMTLEYFSGDYTRGATGIAHQEVSGYQSYYSGRIKAISWRTQKPASVPGLDAASMQAYRYDAKYQLTEAVWGSVNLAAATGTNVFTASATYRETISGYDAHGNISGLSRTDGAGAVRHNFTAANAYQYAANSNKLSRIPNYALYTYDADGQMTAQQKDVASSPVLNQYVEYDGAGMVVAVYSDAARTQKKVSYAYDEGGLRVKKVNHVTNITTYYVNGVIYDNEATAGGVIAQKEIPLSGSGRIGIYRVVENQYTYELSDHLGNVRAVISATKVNGRADVLEYSDYYTIGGVARSGGTMRYRYGYQGQFAERDKETEWNSFDLRQYDPVVGRWLSPDPYGQYNSPYLAMGNDWAGSVDADGGFATKFGAWLYNVLHFGGSGSIANYYGFWQVAHGSTVVAGAVGAGAAASSVISGAARRALDFANGFGNAHLSNNLSIAGTDISLYKRETRYISKAHQAGQMLGDAAATVQGAYETISGLTTMAGGVAGGVVLAIPSGGTVAIPGVAVVGVGALQTAHGVSTAANGLENLFNQRQVNADGNSGGGKFKGGKKSTRDKDFGIKDKDFWNWWHRDGKKAYGGEDITDDIADEVYKDWIDLGKPKGAK